jgi:beta-lactamase class A
LVLCAPPALADDTPLEARAKEVCTLFRSDPAGLEKLFSPAFLAQVPPEKLHELTKQISAKYGRCTAVRVTRPEGLRKGELVMTLEKRFEAKSTLALDDQAPHLVSGFFIHPPAPMLASLDEVVGKLKALPGTTSLLVTPLGEGKPLVAWNEEQPLAIGSAFKLWILAELARQVEGGRRADEAVTLKAEWKSLPSGIMQDWPTGAPVTLHTLATLMISRSDNTATDHLLLTLGREAVEKSLPGTGNHHPEGMRPFLTTGEMFRLKLVYDPKERARFAKAKEPERRKMLAEMATKTAKAPGFAELASFTRPMDIATIEWFASTGDLCRVMDRLRQAKALKDVLAVNPGLALDKQRWSFIGYKGGSEPGVMNMTYLLERKDGKAFCVSASWNDPKDNLAEEVLPGLVTTAISLIP